MEGIILEFFLIGVFHFFLMLIILICLLRYNLCRISSPEFLYVSFSFLHIFSLLVFSLDKGTFEAYLKVNFTDNFEQIVIFLFLKILIDLVYLLVSFSLTAPLFLRLQLIPFSRIGRDLDPSLGGAVKFFGFLLAFVGGGFLLGALLKAGGIVYLWSNLSQRSVLFEGAGVSLLLSETLLQFSAFVLYVYYLYVKKMWKGVLAVSLISVGLALIGGRSPVVFLIFVIFMTHFTFFSLFKLKLFHIIFLLLIVLMGVCVGKLREDGAIGLLKESPGKFLSEAVLEFPRHASPYFSKIRRSVVIMDYFEEKDYWYGKQYNTLLTAVIPRSIYPDKPIIDGGRLVYSMYKGDKVEPTMGIDDAPKTGWPEGNMAGFMNFGYVGLILFTMISALLVKNLYLISIKHSFGMFFVYLSTVFLGPIALDPYSIFRFIGYLAPVIVLLVGFRFLLYIRNFLIVVSQNRFAR